jgi:hypothetical protein
VAQVVGPAHQWCGGVGVAERFVPRGVEDLQIGPFGDDPATRADEDPPAWSAAELIQMVAEQRH